MKNHKTQSERMKELLKSFDNKGEILKEQSEINLDEKQDISIQLEAERNKEIARVHEEKKPLNEWINSTSQFAGNVAFSNSFGQTVNSFTPMVQNNNKYNPNYTYLQPSEALTIAIDRTLKSGAPINDISFYDEINWVLNNMGFNSKSPIDIKSAILKLMENKV